MFYDFSVTVLANTAQSEPVEQICRVSKGVVQRVSIQFPRGTYARVFVQILYHEFQVWPTDPDGAFNADGYVLDFEESFPLDTEPFELKVRAWSTADIYNYDINVRFGILRPEEVEQQSGMLRGLKQFLAKVGFRG